MSSRVPVRIGDCALSTIHLMLRASGLPSIEWQHLIDSKAHASSCDLEDPEGRFELTDLMRVGETLTHIAPAGLQLGLAMGRHYRDTDFGLPGQIARTASTLGEALEAFVRYQPLLTRCYRGSPTVHRGTVPAMRLYSIAPYNRYNCFVVDSALAGWARQITWLTGRRDLVQAVDFEYEHCSYAYAMEDFFAVPVRFGQMHNQLILQPGALATPVVTAQPSLHAQLRRLGDQLLQAQAVGETLTGRLQQWLGPRLQGQSPSLEAAAEAMGMAAWTLRRRLQLENSSYQNLLDDLRRDLATGHIRETTLSFGEVAYMLGFSSPGAFQRAFKRWTGETPGDYRRRILTQRRLQISTASSQPSSRASA